MTAFEQSLHTSISNPAFADNGVELSSLAIGVKNERDISMTVELSEEEMRRALFGSSSPATVQSPKPQKPEVVTTSPANARPRKTAKPLSPKLRVTLHVTKVFEGDTDVLVYDADTLSTFVAEQEAKAEAKKKKYKYIEVVSIKPIG